MLPAGFNASVGVTGRRGRLLDDDTIIPNFGAIVGQAALSYAFLDGRGHLQATGTYERARYRDREESRQLGDYFDLDVALAYDVTPMLGVVVRGQNLSTNTERWDQYEEPPFVVMGGFRFRW